jgi:hypothetical protein
MRQLYRYSAAFSFSVRCFWAAMEMFSADERRNVLQFATGLSSPPAGGFRNLVGYMGDAVPFTLGELAMPRRGSARWNQVDP